MFKGLIRNTTARQEYYERGSAGTGRQGASLATSQSGFSFTSLKPKLMGRVEDHSEEHQLNVYLQEYYGLCSALLLSARPSEVAATLFLKGLVERRSRA